MQFYGPDERVDLSKPFAENAVFAYGLLRLYCQTGELAFLVPAMHTVARLIRRFEPKEETYYLIKAVQLSLEHSLPQIYRQNLAEIEDLVEKGRADSSLSTLLGQTTPLVGAPGADP